MGNEKDKNKHIIDALEYLLENHGHFAIDTIEPEEGEPEDNICTIFCPTDQNMNGYVSLIIKTNNPRSTKLIIENVPNLDNPAQYKCFSATTGEKSDVVEVIRNFHLYIEEVSSKKETNRYLETFGFIIDPIATRELRKSLTTAPIIAGA